MTENVSVSSEGLLNFHLLHQVENSEEKCNYFLVIITTVVTTVNVNSVNVAWTFFYSAVFRISRYVD